MSKKLTHEYIVLRAKTDRLQNLKNLNLWGSDIDDVSIFREMPALEVISLSVNKIRTLKDFANMQNLRELALRKNLISDIREVKYLSTCPNLRTLWLKENPISDMSNYRSAVISMLPQLTKLDDVQITEDERMQAGGGDTEGNEENDYYYEDNNRNYGNSQYAGYQKRPSQKRAYGDVNEDEYMDEGEYNVGRTNSSKYSKGSYHQRRNSNEFNSKGNSQFQYEEEYQQRNVNRKTSSNVGYSRPQVGSSQQVYRKKKAEPFYEGGNYNGGNDEEMRYCKGRDNGSGNNANVGGSVSSNQGSNVYKSLLFLIKELDVNELAQLKEEIENKIDNY